MTYRYRDNETSKRQMASIHLYFAGKQVGDTQKHGNPRCAVPAESRSICTDRRRPGPTAALQVPPTSDTCRSVAILMNSSQRFSWHPFVCAVGPFRTACFMNGNKKNLGWHLPVIPQPRFLHHGFRQPLALCMRKKKRRKAFPSLS